MICSTDQAQALRCKAFIPVWSPNTLARGVVLWMSAGLYLIGVGAAAAEGAGKAFGSAIGAMEAALRALADPGILQTTGLSLLTALILVRMIWDVIVDGLIDGKQSALAQVAITVLVAAVAMFAIHAGLGDATANTTQAIAAAALPDVKANVTASSYMAVFMTAIGKLFEISTELVELDIAKLAGLLLMIFAALFVFIAAAIGAVTICASNVALTIALVMAPVFIALSVHRASEDIFKQWLKYTVAAGLTSSISVLVGVIVIRAVETTAALKPFSSSSSTVSLSSAAAIMVTSIFYIALMMKAPKMAGGMVGVRVIDGTDGVDRIRKKI